MSYGHLFKNVWEFKCYERQGGALLWTERVENLIPTEQLNNILTVGYKNPGVTTLWYVGLVSTASFTGFAAGDTAAQINGANGWIEFIGYSETLRQILTLGTVAGGSADNASSPATFTINVSGTIHGGFITTTNVKGGVAGVLGGEAAFNTDFPLTTGNVLDVQITLSAQSA